MFLLDIYKNYKEIRLVMMRSNKVILMLFDSFCLVVGVVKEVGIVVIVCVVLIEMMWLKSLTCIPTGSFHLFVWWDGNGDVDEVVS